MLKYIEKRCYLCYKVELVVAQPSEASLKLSVQSMQTNQLANDAALPQNNDVSILINDMFHQI